jgi:hypothetical protein
MRKNICQTAVKLQAHGRMMAAVWYVAIIIGETSE